MSNNISCDICKYGRRHDYILDNYYCDNKYCIHYGGDHPKITNCELGEIDQPLYDHKYKPYKNNENISKELIYKELEKILFGIKLKNIDTIMEEINDLKGKITSYREPYKCETCAVQDCEVYALGCRNCTGWK